jgi:hypothetical protein
LARIEVQLRNVTQNILAGLMRRTAEERMSAAQLKVVLNNEANPGDLLLQAPSKHAHAPEG